MSKIDNIVIVRMHDGKPSGVMRYVEMLIAGLMRLSTYNIILITFSLVNCQYSQKKINSRLTIVTFPIDNIASLNKLHMRCVKKHYNLLINAIKPYLTDQFNVFHFQEFCLYPFAELLKLLFNVKIVTHLHVIPWKFEYEHDRNKFNQIQRQILNKDYHLISNNEAEKRMYELSDEIITVTKMAKSYIYEAFNVDFGKISVIYNGISDIANRKETKHDEFENNKILYVGRLSEEKGFMNLLEALNCLYNRRVAFEFTAVGEASYEIKTLIKNKYNHLPITLMGRLSYKRLQNLYAQRPIGIIPSIHEQCSYTAIEMSMYGLPIVYSKVDGLSEIFEDGVNGLGFEYVFNSKLGLMTNHEFVADIILKLLENDCLRQRIGNNARFNYLERFSIDDMIRQTLKIYQNV